MDILVLTYDIETVPLPPPTISISLFFNQVGMWIWSSSLNISFDSV